MMRLSRILAAVKTTFLIMVDKRDQQKFHAHRLLVQLEGDIFETGFQEFCATARGKALVATRPDPLALLGDLDVLGTYPEGSLGRCYKEFMNLYNLGSDFYLDIVLPDSESNRSDQARRWFRLRNDTTHDLRHVLTGYGADYLGESCLLAFRYAQLRHPGVFILMLLGTIPARFTSRGKVLRPLVEAYHRGKSAVALDLLPWEENLERPLSHVRASLRLNPPLEYPTPFAPDSYIDDMEYRSPGFDLVKAAA